MINGVKTTVRDKWINQVNFCLRKNTLVYVNSPKCASTFYRSLLINNGWQDDKFTNIDWTKDHVFGFIMEPWKLRAKGIAEDLLTSYSVEQYLLNNLGKKFWEDHLTFGTHSIPISMRWSGYTDRIDWIPLDLPVNADTLLKKLLEKYHIVLDYSVATHQHKTEKYKQEIFKKISDFVGHGNGPLQLMMATDVDLYQSVTLRINTDGQCWDEISWLRNN
jgi:hypothetical protein